MRRRFGLAILFVVLIAPFLAAQAPKRIRVAPREKPRLGAAVTVIDLRNVFSDKKPPKRGPDQVVLPRMMMPGSSPNRALTGLSSGQLSEALVGAQIGPLATNVYAHFTPGQSYAPGKGYLFLASPVFVFPDHVEFQSVGHSADPSLADGPKVVLREPGSYTLDFLVEFTGAPPESNMGCYALIGYGIPQVHPVKVASGPQHIVLVFNMDQERAAAPDEARSVGIRCYQSPTGKTPWTLYLVDVTKN